MEAVTELFTNFGEILFLLALGALGGLFKTFRTWWEGRSARRLERGINQNFKIRELLAELRALTEADRVCLWQFSNGSYFFSGASVMNLTKTHFVTRVGVAAPLSQHGIQTTHMVMTLKELKEGKPVVMVKDWNTVSDDAFQTALFTATGNITSLIIAVRDPRGRWIGILAASWMGVIDGDPGTSRIGAYAKQVGEFLSNS